MAKTSSCLPINSPIYFVLRATKHLNYSWAHTHPRRQSSQHPLQLGWECDQALPPGSEGKQLVLHLGYFWGGRSRPFFLLFPPSCCQKGELRGRTPSWPLDEGSFSGMTENWRRGASGSSTATSRLSSTEMQNSICHSHVGLFVTANELYLNQDSSFIGDFSAWVKLLQEP